MDVVVTWAAEHRDSLPHVAAFELPFVPFVPVPCAWYEMMTGECLDYASAEFT